MMNGCLQFISLALVFATVPLSSHAPSADVRLPQNNLGISKVVIPDAPQKTYIDQGWLKAPEGPWGTLEYRRYYLDFPKQFSQLKPVTHEVKWYGGHLTSQKFQERVRMGFTPEEQTFWAKSCKCIDEPAGLSIYPSSDFRWLLSEHSRSLLYNWLAMYPQNYQQRNAFLHSSSSPWLLNTGLRHELIDAVKALSYHSEATSKFADLDLLEDYFSNNEERAELFSILNRQPYCEIRLKAPSQVSMESFLSYWGSNGQREQIEQLLGGLDPAVGKGILRLEHVLPIIPASRLNTYPALPLNDDKPKENCFWTAFNFFNQIPDERLTEGDFVTETLYNSYQQVSGALQYGDIIMMTDDAGYPMHAAVYLAADFVYTKNGGHETRPWVVMKLNDLETIYSDHGYRVTCYRKKIYHDLIFHGLSNRLDLTQNDSADHFVFQPNRLVNGQYTK